MASQTAELTLQQLQQLLNTASATLAKKTASSLTYVSQKNNQTITVFASGRANTVKVQIMSGCAC